MSTPMPCNDVAHEMAASANEALAPARIAELRELIDRQLRTQNVYEKVRQVVADFVLSDQQGNALNESTAGTSSEQDDASASRTDSVVDLLRQRGIIQEILGSMSGSYRPLIDQSVGDEDSTLPGVSRLSSQTAGGGAVKDAKRLYLQVKITAGKAFIGHLHAEGDTSPEQEYYQLCMSCNLQRFEGISVLSGIEPPFNDTFLVDLGPISNVNPDGTSCSSDIKRSLKMDFPLHFVLLRVSATDKSVRDLVATASVEWRRCLGRTGISLAVELRAPGQGGKSEVSVGILQLSLDVIPVPGHRHGLSASEIVKEIELCNTAKADAHRQFYHYAKRWWQDFTSISDVHKNRLVKIFAEDETGKYQSVCSFVCALRPGRLFDSAKHAARFVGLIPFTRSEAVGGGREEVWHSMHTFLALRKGDCEDHAVLLCNLLLGFGLEAYICVGTVAGMSGSSEVDHVWVMTRSGNPGARDIVFWESLSGQRFRQTGNGQTSLSPRQQQASVISPQAVKHIYKTIGCVFSHESFYGNRQQSDSINGCSFELENENYWKAMDKRLITSLRHQQPVTMIPPIMIQALEEERLEGKLRSKIAKIRKEMYQATTSWDESLCYAMTPALSSYELERTQGVVVGTEEFQAAVKRLVPEGHTFKGFPTMFLHRDVDRMILSLQQFPMAKDILSTKGDRMAFALRTKVTPYPEDITVVWLMIAVRYQI